MTIVPSPTTMDMICSASHTRFPSSFARKGSSGLGFLYPNRIPRWWFCHLTGWSCSSTTELRCVFSLAIPASAVMSENRPSERWTTHVFLCSRPCSAEVDGTGGWRAGRTADGRLSSSPAPLSIHFSSFVLFFLAFFLFLIETPRAGKNLARPTARLRHGSNLFIEFHMIDGNMMGSELKLNLDILFS